MAFNLLDSVKALFTHDLVRQAASSLGENESEIHKAISGIAPSILGGIISHANSGVEEAGVVLQQAKGAARSGILNNLGNIVRGNIAADGSGMLQRLFGDRIGRITDALAGFAGIKESSAISLMATTTSGAFGLLGEHVIQNSMSAGGLSNFLSSQRASVAAALPANLSALSSFVGLNSTGAAARPRTPVAVHPPTPDSTRKSWLTPLLLAIGAIVLVWVIIKACSGGPSTKASQEESAATSDSSSTVTTMPASIKVQLPDGTELDAYKGGIEDKLVAYLNSTDPADSISSSRWFDFDNLNFKTGSAELTDSSMKQVQNLAAILKAYPKVSLKIGGYTDKTGNEQENMKLSQQRADAVLDALKKAGASATQLVGAQGYGSQFAKAAANAPDEVRRADRRISVSVRSK